MIIKSWTCFLNDEKSTTKIIERYDPTVSDYTIGGSFVKGTHLALAWELKRTVSLGSFSSLSTVDSLYEAGVRRMDSRLCYIKLLQQLPGCTGHDLTLDLSNPCIVQSKYGVNLISQSHPFLLVPFGQCWPDKELPLISTLFLPP